MLAVKTFIGYRLVRGSTINNEDYDYPNPSFRDITAKSAAAYFDQNFTRNVTTVVGQSAFLNCKVLHLDNKTVSSSCAFSRCFSQSEKCPVI